MSCNESLFTGDAIAEAYQKFRPTYPKGVVERIISYLGDKKPGPFNLAVDVGCGSGQSTAVLGDYFEQVIGCDVSESQIREAIDKNLSPNVEYRNGSDRNIPAADHTVDLVTSAQAAHWFDQNQFYKEVDRVLTSNGCLAVYGYGFAQLQRNTNGKQLQNIYDDFLYKTLDGFWGDEIKQVGQRYTCFTMPYAESERDDTFSIEIDYSVAEFVGFLSSLSIYHKYLKVNPDKQCVLVELEKNESGPAQRFSSIGSQRHGSLCLPETNRLYVHTVVRASSTIKANCLGMVWLDPALVILSFDDGSLLLRIAKLSRLGV
ncbi:putative methyltransferase DDB_G0268948 [Saccoglossus kowalevskii]|uniref:Methyltransferase DDB_G0268948-like n=1 Tax=Saccoglossus kowalevskii TaxID=10224 RepID=A0ABM0LY26_SACKO|nr:PREDICTED: putative methyltransferase DDB_G0268948-like [Saccoglossus kowalevskii]